MHSLLKRQIKRFFGDAPLPADARLRAFIEAVDNAYHEFDIDRGMLERSLDLSSQELLQSNSEMRAMFQALPDLVFRVNREGTILAFKTGAADDLVLSPGLLSGKKIQDIPDAFVGSLFREALQQVAETKSLVSIDYSLQMRGGEGFYEARLVPLIEDQILVVIRNMTEHRQAEEALRQAEQQYRSIFENALEGIFQCTPQGRFITANPTLSRMLGYTSPDELMASVSDMFHDLPLEAVRQDDYVRELSTHGTVRGFECQLRRKDRGTIWASFDTRAAVDSNGQLLYYEGMVEDVTERKRLEERYLQSQKMEAFGQLAGGIAHDFNNILTVIKGNTNLLQSRDISEEDLAATLRDIDLAAERAANLTRQLLTFSRRQPMRAKDLDLNEVVASTTRMLRRLIGEHIDLEARFSSSDPTVHADAGMMTQLLVNLAVNARDAMPKGGTIVVETAVLPIEEVPSPGLRRLAPNAEDAVRLGVVDTGCGIPADSLPHIFEPFFTTKEVGKGTGLGLATVFGIVEQHHGLIDVQSRVDEGTAFNVYLPRLERPARPAAQAAPALMQKGTETILLVEDEAPLRSLVRRQLEHAGYTVYEAASGVEALDVWEERRAEIDLVVSDIVMPGGLSGKDLAEQLLAERPTMKIILCSGYAEEVPGRDWPFGDRASFLEKPFDRAQLLRQVRSCLDRVDPVR